MKHLIDKLERAQTLSLQEFCDLIENRDGELDEHLFSRAMAVKERIYGRDVYLRGLIEFTNHCKNDCYYCGIRRSNRNAERYRLSEQEILDCCETGYGLGFRTFVLQGGEDPYFDDQRMVALIRAIKSRYPDCALTLSAGEKSRESYKAFRDAGADRYLLRHETADPDHYRLLHPASLSPENRKRCLYELKELGFQTGSGFMVGSPHQTPAHLAADLLFLKELSPHMIGIGPFIPHRDTPFGDAPPGTLELTLFLIGILRLMFPSALIPATTALGTIHPMGRERGLLAGANVVMPNLSPVGVRKKYTLYDNKICTGEEAAECAGCLKKRVESVGHRIVSHRGDYKAG